MAMYKCVTPGILVLIIALSATVIPTFSFLTSCNQCHSRITTRRFIMPSINLERNYFLGTRRQDDRVFFGPERKKINRTDAQIDELLMPVFRYQPYHEMHRTLAHRMGRVPKLSEWAAAMNTTIERYMELRKECAKSVEKLIELHRGLIYTVAVRYQSFKFRPEVVLIAAEQGFADGLMKYKKQPMYTLASSVIQHINAAIARAVTRLVAAPLADWQQRLHKKVTQAAERLREQGKVISDEKVAEEIGLPYALYLKLHQQVQQAQAERAMQLQEPTQLLEWGPFSQFETEDEFLNYVTAQWKLRTYDDTFTQIARQEGHIFNAPRVLEENLLTTEEYNVYYAKDVGFQARLWSLQEIASLFNRPEDEITRLYDSAKLKISTMKFVKERKRSRIREEYRRVALGRVKLPPPKLADMKIRKSQQDSLVMQRKRFRHEREA